VSTPGWGYTRPRIWTSLGQLGICFSPKLQVMNHILLAPTRSWGSSPRGAWLGFPATDGAGRVEAACMPCRIADADGTRWFHSSVLLG
jgi:hypothetical protein